MLDVSLFLRNLRLKILHLTGSWRTTQVWLQLVFLLLVISFIVVINEPIARDSDLLTQVYLVLSLATFGAEWSLPQSGAASTSLSFEILRIIVPLVALGGLLLVGFRSIGYWMQFRLMPKQGHTVVFGLGNAGMAYVNHWQSLEKKLAHGPLLVVERNSENPNIARVRSMGIPVIISDVSNDSWSAFRKTWCHKADRIVSMMDADSRDIELTLHVQRYLHQQSSPRKPKLFVQINEPKLAKRLSDYPRICSSDLIDLRFESLYSLFAEDLFLRHPPDVYADLFAEKRPHIAIHGYNDLGEQVLNYCALLCHYRNHQIARVTVYDSNPERAEQAVRERHPGLLEGAGDGYQAPLELHVRSDGQNELDTVGQDPVTQHIICELDEEVAFTRALNLRARSLRQKKGNAPIFVKSASTEGLAALLDSNTGETEIPDGIYPFGMVDEVSDPEILDNSELDRVSKGIHEFAYRAVFQADTRWSDLDASKRRSNRYAALHLDTKFRAAGWRRILKRDTGTFLGESTLRIQRYFPHVAAVEQQDGKNAGKEGDAVLERLSVMEHNRWVGAQVAEGWVQDEQRFDPLKMHNLLEPWSRLKEEEKPKDKAQVRVLPGLVERNKEGINAAVAEAFEDKQEEADRLTDPEKYDTTLLERDDGRESEYVVPVINVGILCPRVPQKEGGSSPGDEYRYTVAIDNTVRQGVRNAFEKLSERARVALADLSVPETLAFTIITPLVSDPEQAAFHYLNARLQEILSEEIEREHNGFRPGYQTEALITLPLPYNFMTETGVFGEAIPNSNPGVDKFSWFPGGRAGLQCNAGKRNVRYAEMPLIREVRDFGRGPERAPALQEQFEWTWDWIAERSDFLIMVVDDEISDAKADEIKNRFSSQEGRKEEEESDGLFPEPELFSSAAIGDRFEVIDIRPGKSITGRHIRVFLSSVFYGMDKEREDFRTTVQAKAQKLCKKYAVTFTLIDLRWGITDRDIREEMLLHRCLEEIDKSAGSPCFFIGLIGNRYGTAFEKQQIESYLTSPNAKYAQWLEEKLHDQSVAVTDLEFLYAEDLAHQYPDLKPLYYIRKDARDSPDDLLQEQIHRIEQFTDYLAIDGYRSLEAVGEHFLGQLEELLNEHFSSGDIVDPYERSKRAVLNEVSVEGVETEILAETFHLVRERQLTKSNPVFLQGNAGSGKTFLLTQLQKKVRLQCPERTILCLGNFEDPIELAVKEIGALGREKLAEVCLREKIDALREALNHYTGRLSVFIDAADSSKLAFDPSVPNHDILLRLLSAMELKEGVVLVVSYQSKCTFRPDFSIDGLSDRDLEEFVSSFGHRFGKTIPDEVLKVFQNNPTLRLPIAASLIFAQLVQATNAGEVWETVQHIEQNQLEKQHEDSESGWDDLVRFFIRDIVKDYPKVDAKDLSEKLPALLNDYMGTDGISIDDLARECGIAEAVVLEVTERLRPALYIVDDHFRSRKEFFTGLNEAKLESRINLVQRHWQNQEDAFLPLLLRNMETYFYWVMGGRSKVEEWLGDYEKNLTTPSCALMFYDQDYRNFRRLMLFLRYINPSHYLGLCSNIGSEPLEHKRTALRMIRDPFIVVEYPLFCLATAQRLKQEDLEHSDDLKDLEDIKDLYGFALSYQAFMVFRRKALGHKFSQPKFLVTQEYEQGSSLDAFLNFKGFGEVVYDTVLYKTYLAEGFLRFGDFERNVASHLENNAHAGYIYGKLLSVHDEKTEDQVLAREKQLYRELFQEDPQIVVSDEHTRNHLKTYLATP